jgi:hypothetical protein
MARFERAIMETITHPDDRRPDPRPGRERYSATEGDQSGWLRVIVDFGDEPGWIVTPFGHSEDPS